MSKYLIGSIILVACAVVWVVAPSEKIVYKEQPQPKPACTQRTYKVGDQIYIKSLNADGVIVSEETPKEKPERCWYGVKYQESELRCGFISCNQTGKMVTRFVNANQDDITTRQEVK